MKNTRALVALIGGLILVALIVVIAVLMMPSLNPEGEPRECTLIGCADGLTVHLAGEIPGPYTVEVGWAAGQLTFQCTGDETSPGDFGCLPDGGVRLDGVTPEEVTVTASWEGGSATETLRPTYEVTRPNGPDCPPECRQGTVTMTLP